MSTYHQQQQLPTTATGPNTSSNGQCRKAPTAPRRGAPISLVQRGGANRPNNTMMTPNNVSSGGYRYPTAQPYSSSPSPAYQHNYVMDGSSSSFPDGSYSPRHHTYNPHCHNTNTSNNNCAPSHFGSSCNANNNFGNTNNANLQHGVGGVVLGSMNAEGMMMPPMMMCHNDTNNSTANPVVVCSGPRARNHHRQQQRKDGQQQAGCHDGMASSAAPPRPPRPSATMMVPQKQQQQNQKNNNTVTAATPIMSNNKKKTTAAIGAAVTPSFAVPAITPLAPSAPAVKPSHQVIMVKPLPAYLHTDEALLALGRRVLLSQQQQREGGEDGNNNGSFVALSENHLPYAAKVMRASTLSVAAVNALQQHHSQQQKDAPQKTLLPSTTCFCEEGYGFLLFASEEAGLAYMRVAAKLQQQGNAKEALTATTKRAAEVMIAATSSSAAVREDYTIIDGIKRRLYRRRRVESKNNTIAAAGDKENGDGNLSDVSATSSVSSSSCDSCTSYDSATSAEEGTTASNDANTDDGCCTHCTQHRRQYRIYQRAKANKFGLDGVRVGGCAIVAPVSVMAATTTSEEEQQQQVGDHKGGDTAPLRSCDYSSPYQPIAANDTTATAMRQLFGAYCCEMKLSMVGIDGTVAAKPSIKSVALRKAAGVVAPKVGTKTGKNSNAATATAADGEEGAAATTTEETPAPAPASPTMPHPPATSVTALRNIGRGLISKIPTATSVCTTFAVTIQRPLIIDVSAPCTNAAVVVAPAPAVNTITNKGDNEEGITTTPATPTENGLRYFNDDFSKAMADTLRRNTATATTAYATEYAFPHADYFGDVVEPAAAALLLADSSAAAAAATLLPSRHHTHHRHCVVHRAAAVLRRAERRKDRAAMAKVASMSQYAPRVLHVALPAAGVPPTSVAAMVAPPAAAVPAPMTVALAHFGTRGPPAHMPTADMSTPAAYDPTLAAVLMVASSSSGSPANTVAVDGNPITAAVRLAPPKRMGGGGSAHPPAMGMNGAPQQQPTTTISGMGNMYQQAPPPQYHGNGVMDIAHHHHPTAPAPTRFHGAMLPPQPPMYTVSAASLQQQQGEECYQQHHYQQPFGFLASMGQQQQSTSNLADGFMGMDASSSTSCPMTSMLEHHNTITNAANNVHTPSSSLIITDSRHTYISCNGRERFRHNPYAYAAAMLSGSTSSNNLLMMGSSTSGGLTANSTSAGNCSRSDSHVAPASGTASSVKTAAAVAVVAAVTATAVVGGISTAPLLSAAAVAVSAASAVVSRIAGYGMGSATTTTTATVVEPSVAQQHGRRQSPSTVVGAVVSDAAAKACDGAGAPPVDVPALSLGNTTNKAGRTANNKAPTASPPSNTKATATRRVLPAPAPKKSAVAAPPPKPSVARYTLDEFGCDDEVAIDAAEDVKEATSRYINNKRVNGGGGGSASGRASTNTTSVNRPSRPAPTAATMTGGMTSGSYVPKVSLRTH